MKKVLLNEKNIKKFQHGYPLIQEIDLKNRADLERTGEWLTFYSQDNQYLGTGYLGRQNKGVGWIITHDPDRKINQSFFAHLFRQALAKRQPLLHSEETTAFRVFNGEGDGLGGVTVDIYNGFAVLSWYNDSIYYHQKVILAALLAELPEISGVYEKIRFTSPDLPESQLIWGELAPEPLIIRENGIHFATYLNDGLMTGIFLDQRDVRNLLIDGLASGRTVLNTFSYTGAFSVAAAMGGAAETTSVDLAKRSLPKTREQFSVNGLDPDDHRIIVMDVFEFFNYAVRKQLMYDVVILDPPSFSRNRKNTFSVTKNYSELTENAVKLITKDGVLIASTNAANLPMERFMVMVEQGIRKAQRSYKQIGRHRLPFDFALSKDFKEGNYLKVLVYRVQ